MNRQSATDTVRVWDIWVRLFHWSLTASVLFMLWNGMSGEGFRLWHRQVGEIVLLLLVFRWGLALFGSSNLRLRALLRSPHAALHHFRELREGRAAPERGHNAAGALAAIILLVLLSFQAVSGLFIVDDPDFPLVEGALHGMVSADTTGTLKALHALNARLLIALTTIHIGAVFIYLLHAKLDRIGPMLTGHMPWPRDMPRPTVAFQPFIAGLSYAVLVVGVGGYLLGWWF